MARAGLSGGGLAGSIDANNQDSAVVWQNSIHNTVVLADEQPGFWSWTGWECKRGIGKALDGGL
jgi:hypothetical protein